MHRAKFARGAALWTAALGFAAIILLPVGPGAVAKTGAVAAPAKAATSAEPPAQVRALLNLLADPAVQKWLEREGVQPAVPTLKPKNGVSVSDYLDSRMGAMRAHIVALAAAIPDLPTEYRRASALVSADLGDGGRLKALLLVAVFVGLGFGVEWLFRWATRSTRRHLDTFPMATAHDRLHIVAARFLYAVGLVAAFAVGSVGAFLAFNWPARLGEMIFGVLVVFLVIRVAAVVGHLLLAPAHEHFRIVPMETAAARFWWRRLTAFVGWFAFGWVWIGIQRSLGVALEARQLIAYTLGLVLMAIALDAVWRRPAAADEADAAVPERRRLGSGGQNTLLSVGVVLLWGMWVAGAMASFWLLLVVMVLPLAIGITRRAVEHVLRPPGSAEIAAGPPSVLTVSLERGLRALWIIGAVALLAWGWGVDLIHLAGQDTPFSRLVHGALNAVVIILVADLLWQATRAAIDRKLGEVGDLGPPNTEEARRRARLHTLLPIFRNLLFVVVVVFAVMMVLAAMGVQIGPLIAGAGVIGVAIGFGAQSIVRDIISGMFYLLDDAFRVGEYIQSGNYKGTVESFSFRSVRLRHQRGALYTVPFGLLGAVQNQSRDWVIDKLMVGITYDSDIDKARKLIKQIGLDLQKEPEFAPLIIEPLKMQGVDALGDYAVQLRMKMMTLPGENFVIRRQALAMIKKAFDANGIKFAFPTVTIAGDGEASQPAAAVAQQALQLAHPAAAAE